MTLDEFRMNFSVWAACRAAQAGSAIGKREELTDALFRSGIVDFLEDTINHDIDEESYLKEHNNWIDKIQDHMINKYRKYLSFGRAAKLVAVFIKTYFILAGQHSTKLAHVAYPPIDRILLEGIDEYYTKDLSKRYQWHKLEQSQYENLITELKEYIGSEPFWTIEKYWVPCEL